METWIEVKAKYDKETKDGLKLVTEPFLVDALTCTEAEARVIGELAKTVTGELSVISNGITNISRVYNKYDGAKYYKSKIFYQEGDRKNVTHVIVKANDFDRAYSNLLDALGKDLPDYEPETLVETKYVRVYETVPNEP